VDLSRSSAAIPDDAYRQDAPEPTELLLELLELGMRPLVGLPSG
jgi:hypothetical protein